MIDALLYAVRDGIRAAGMGYGKAECDITDDGRPQAISGNVFVAVHGGKSSPGNANDNNMYELFGFAVTLTIRVVVPLDRVGDQLIARDLPLRDMNDVPLAQRQGFNAKVEQLRAFLHMNWRLVVLTGQTPNSANDNLAQWATGTVYGFCEPMRYEGADVPVLVGADWMEADPDGEEFAVKVEMRFAGAKRFQPVLAASGSFV